MLDCNILYAIVLYANILQPASSSTSALTSLGCILRLIGKIYLIGVELKLKLGLTT